LGIVLQTSKAFIPAPVFANIRFAIAGQTEKSSLVNSFLRQFVKTGTGEAGFRLICLA